MFVGYTNDRFFPQTNPYISNVSQYFELGLPVMRDFLTLKGDLWLPVVNSCGETSSMNEED